MDPNATLREMIEAAEQNDWPTYRELSLSLFNWIAKGGFIPRDWPH